MSDNHNQSPAMIHPIIMYPFTHPDEEGDLRALYQQLIDRLSSEPDKYKYPITIINSQTIHRLEHGGDKLNKFENFIHCEVENRSKTFPSWCVDTCQMWLTGFGKAFDEHQSPNDVYWLIPGDFNYNSAQGQEVLEKLEIIANNVLNEEACYLCLGEITTDANSSKQLIDTYGTYGLLYNWFPKEAKEIRLLTSKPRTEFFAIKHDFLRRMLIYSRWYGYEQTLIFLLDAAAQGYIGRKEVSTVKLGDISDLPQGRDSLSAAMQQVERTERLLKLYWREKNQTEPNWIEEFRRLDAQSEEIRGAALVVLGQLLKI